VAMSLGQSASWEARLRDHMGAALQSGSLKLRDAETGLVLPAHLQVDDGWGRVTHRDVNAWLESQGLDYRWEDSEQPERLPTQTVTASGAVNLSLLATRDRLVDAFGKFTDMDMSWFNNLNDVPALRRARKVAGTGGHGHTTEPWFCPFEVMQWLLSPRRKKGRAMNVVTGWRMLKGHFPKVYAQHESEAPADD
jgi:hypothetical protein